MSLTENGTSSSPPPLVVPLGRTPPYLDPQSQEAVYEVDVSEMPIIIIPIGIRPDKTTGSR